MSKNKLFKSIPLTVGTSECFNVGILGGCCPDCFVYLKGKCDEPQEMLSRLDEEGKVLHIKIYGE